MKNNLQAEIYYYDNKRYWNFLEEYGIKETFEISEERTLTNKLKEILRLNNS